MNTLAILLKKSESERKTRKLTVWTGMHAQLCNGTSLFAVQTLKQTVNLSHIRLTESDDMMMCSVEAKNK